MDNKKSILPELQMPDFATRVQRPDAPAEKKADIPPPLPEKEPVLVAAEPVEEIVTNSKKVAEEIKEAEPKAKPADGSPIADIKDAMNRLQTIMQSYETLDEQIHENKENLQKLQKRLINSKDEKAQLELAYQEATQAAEQAHRGEDDFSDHAGVTQSVKENKITIQSRGCDSVMEHVKNVRKHIIHDTSKAAESLTPLTLSCDLLKANVEYVGLLEETAAAFEQRKQLMDKRAEVNHTIQRLSSQVA